MFEYHDGKRKLMYYLADGDSKEEVKHNIKNKIVLPENWFITGMSGSGKSVFINYHTWKLNKSISAVEIYLTEKEGSEMSNAFINFEPSSYRQHNLLKLNKTNLLLDKLEKDGKIKKEYRGSTEYYIKNKNSAIIYHPITLSPYLPINKKIPPIIYFAFNIKHLNDSCFRCLLSLSKDSDTTKFARNIIRRLSSDDSIYDFIWKAHSSISSTSKFTHDEFFIPEGKGIGDMKAIAKITGSFDVFREHYFIHPSDSPYNLQFMDIVNDNSKRHVFSTKWIRDDIAKIFTYVMILNEIMDIAVRGELKKPLIIVFEELWVLLEKTGNDEYKDELVNQIKKFLNVMRERNCHVILTSQSINISSKLTRGGLIEIFFKLSDDDVEDMFKNGLIDSMEKEFIQSLRKQEYVIHDIEEGKLDINKKIRTHTPPFRIAETGEEYINLYNKYYPEDCLKIKKFIDEIILYREKHIIKSKERFNDFIEKIKKEEKLKELQKQKKEGLDSSKTIIKIKELKYQSRIKDYKLCYEGAKTMLKEGKLSWRAMEKSGNYLDSENHNLSAPTIKKYAILYAQLEDENKKRDEEFLNSV